MIEIFTNSETLKTSDYAKNWTEKSPDSKLSEINKILNNSSLGGINEVTVLKNKIKQREYRDFQIIVGVIYNKCDGKLGGETLKYFNNYITKLKGKSLVIGKTNKELEKLEYGVIENVIDTRSIKKKEALYLKKYRTLSDNEFKRLFSGREKIQQGQIGDCYLVSGIIELSNAQHFDTLMKTGIKRLHRKSGESGYQVKIPLGEPSGRKIIIKDSELKIAKIRGKNGYKLLELAYAKNKLRKNDKVGNMYRPITSAEFSKIKGGRTKEVLETFLGKNNISFNTFGDENREKPLNKLSKNEKKEIIKFLKNYKPSIGNKFLSLSSIGGDENKGYKVGKNTLYHKHAYSITKIYKNKKNEIISIITLNPRNDKSGKGSQYQSFSLNEFFAGFSYISNGKLKMESFLNG